MRRWTGLLIVAASLAAGAGCADYQERRHLRAETQRDSRGTMEANRGRFADTSAPEAGMPMTLP